VEGTLFRPFQQKPSQLRQIIARYIDNTSYQVYYTNDFPNDFGVSRYGFYSAVNRDLPSGREKVILNTAFPNFLAYWSDKYNDYHPWNRMHYNLLMADYCHLLLTLRETGGVYKDNAGIEAMINFTCSNYQGLLNRIEFIVNSKNLDNLFLTELFEQAEAKSDGAFSKLESSKLDYYQGIYNLRIENSAEAKLAFESSLEIWPHPDNPSFATLMNLQDNE
jgi:hypothetical protein